MAGGSANAERLTELQSEGAPVATTVELDASSTEVEVESLQAELDRLADEIRETVVFATGSSELTAEAMTTLDQVVDALNAHLQPVVVIGGHTDDRGDAVANQALSQSRANSVVAYLTTQGIAGERLRAVGFGESDPLVDNDSGGGRATNRRVEFAAFGAF